MNEPPKGVSGKRTPGAEADTLKIDATFEEAVRRAMSAPIPSEGILDREKRKRGPNQARRK